MNIWLVGRFLDLQHEKIIFKSRIAVLKLSFHFEEKIKIILEHIRYQKIPPHQGSQKLSQEKLNSREKKQN